MGLGPELVGGSLQVSFLHSRLDTGRPGTEGLQWGRQAWCPRRRRYGSLQAMLLPFLPPQLRKEGPGPSWNVAQPCRTTVTLQLSAHRSWDGRPPPAPTHARTSRRKSLPSLSQVSRCHFTGDTGLGSSVVPHPSHDTHKRVCALLPFCTKAATALFSCLQLPQAALSA